LPEVTFSGKSCGAQAFRVVWTANYVVLRIKKKEFKEKS